MNARQNPGIIIALILIAAAIGLAVFNRLQTSGAPSDSLDADIERICKANPSSPACQ